MSIVIAPATLQDVDELLRLYFLVYGNTYPVRLGTDRQLMSSTIAGGNDIWMIARDTERNIVAGSSVVEVERPQKIGKLVGVVVHPEYRKNNVATGMIAEAVEKLLGGESPLNSIYTTTRTNSLGPQLMCLHTGFIPLGIFPNAHKLKHYETVTLMARYSPRVLQRRHPVPIVSEKLLPLLHAMNANIGSVFVPEVMRAEKTAGTGKELEFEIIEAEHFIMRRFRETVLDSRTYFYPFHRPNALFSSLDGTVEIFAFLSRADRYCTLISTNVPFYKLADGVADFLDALKDHGAEYIETLLPLSDRANIAALLNDDFIPSAIYPAMREVDGIMHDYLAMSRTMDPLNFRGMQIAGPFKPYIDQYVALWKRIHLDTLEVFNEFR